MKNLSHRKAFSKAWRLGAISFATSMALAERVYAQKDPWDQAVQVLQTAFTGPIATGLALVAIVVGRLMFAFGEGRRQAHARRRDLRCRHGGGRGQFHVVALSVTFPAPYSSRFGGKAMERRHNPVSRSLNRPLTLMGAELFAVSVSRFCQITVRGSGRQTRSRRGRLRSRGSATGRGLVRAPAIVLRRPNFPRDS